MLTRMKWLLVLLGICGFMGIERAEGQHTILDIHDVSPGEVVVRGFQLRKTTSVTISAVGLQPDRDESMTAYAWILNGDSRRAEWHMKSCGHLRRKGNKVKVQVTQTLEAGYYEVHYFAEAEGQIDLGGLLNSFFLEEFRSTRRLPEDLGITLTLENRHQGKKDAFECKLKEPEAAIVQLIQTGDDANRSIGFSLSQPMDVNIYAIGEGHAKSRELFDYAWIINADTRDRVWEMEVSKTRHAGGAKKNRLFKDLITLPAGNFLVFYMSDDSHSYEYWNGFPPDDPRYWGVTIYATGSKRGQAVAQPYAEKSRGSNLPLVEMTRIRDSEFVHQAFTLRQATRLRIYAVGESSSSRRMADYGWIIDAGTREKVWSMNYDETEHAGGASKNRMFEGFITVPAGKYIAYYRTDDSHAYRKWNSTSPYDPDGWGMTIWGSGRISQLTPKPAYDENRYTEDVLAQIIRIGDDEKVKEKFRLTHQTQVGVYAVGEGHRSGMDDYGWIETSDGYVVWKMTYRRTRHAGGTSKNRKIREKIILEPGVYYAIYKSDDSHSFEDWNDAPPDDPEHWGLTITKLEP